MLWTQLIIISISIYYYNEDISGVLTISPS